jgi:hypothetical protein
MKIKINELTWTKYESVSFAFFWTGILLLIKLPVPVPVPVLAIRLAALSARIACPLRWSGWTRGWGRRWHNEWVRGGGADCTLVGQKSV